MGILKKIYYNDIFRYIITPAIGFGLGGAIWGFMFANMAFNGNPGNPLAYLSNGVILGIFGGLSLSVFAQNKKYILRNFLFGIIAGLLAFLLGYIIGDFLIFPITIIAGIFSHFITPIGQGLLFLILAQFQSFFIAGCIIGFLFGFSLQKKLLPMVLTGAVSFPAGHIIGIPIGTLLTDHLVESLFSLYLSRFIITCIVLGASLGFLIYRSEKLKKES